MAKGQPKVRRTVLTGKFEIDSYARAPEVRSEYGFRSGKVKPCVPYPIPAGCKSPDELDKHGRPKKLGAKTLGIEKDAPLEERQAACKRAGGVWQEKSARELRPAHVELVLLNAKQAAEFNTRAGPHVRLCTRARAPGVVVPVDSVETAKQVADEFAACVGESKNRTKKLACARKAAGGRESATLGADDVFHAVLGSGPRRQRSRR